MKKLEAISRQLIELAHNVAPKLPDGEVKTNLQRLARRSMEYKNGSFIMLVVGPVKSGKSTLVNLLAHRFVSPTDKLECTVRPSIISNVDDERDCRIDVYRSKVDGRKAEDLDLIVDKLRGIMPDDAEVERFLEKETFALTEDNIKEVIFPSYNKGDRTVITSITTTGSKLLHNDDAAGEGKIFLVDMPGFDGNNVNIENDPLYEAISKRVDLILFVHSSVSAFNVTSAKYLDKLREYNESVPVYLIHNVFDSSYWRDENERQQDVERQAQKEYDEIRRKGFNIEPDFISCVNLGKVTDFTDGMGKFKTDFNEELNAEQVEFAKIEQKLYDKITTNITELRLKRCLDRTAQFRESLLSLLKEKGKGLRVKKDDYDLLGQWLEHIGQELAITDAELDDIVSATTSQAPVSVFDSEIDSRINSSEGMGQCLERLERLANKYFSDVNTFLSENLFQRYKTKTSEFTRRIDERLTSDIESPDMDKVSIAIEERLTRDELRQYVKRNAWWKQMFAMPLSVEVVRDAVRKMKKDLTSHNTMKNLIKDEVHATEKVYIERIAASFQGIRESLISREDLDSLDTLDNLSARLSNIIM
ncbi:MAG: dynamin family protein [Prevotella sp.]|nr:dynamin family protein [Prevotella sp.]